MRRFAMILAVLGTLAASAGVAAATPTSADDAVAYQMNPRHDGFLHSASFAPPLEKRWEHDLGGPVAYPLIADGRVFVTVSGQSSYGSMLYALDGATGQTLWSRTTGTYWSGIAYEAGRVFLVNGDGLLLGLDAVTGAALWARQLPGQYSFSSAPTVVGGIVYTGGAGSGGTLYAVSAATGEVLWTRPVANGDDSSPAILDNRVFVSYACPNAFAFDRISGAPAWTFSNGCSGGGGRTPVVHAGRVYVRDGSSGKVLDAATGTLLDAFGATAAPAFAGNFGVVLSGDDVLGTAVDTGVVRWNVHGATPFTSAPVIVGQTAYVGDAAGVVHALDLATGDQVGAIDVGSPIMKSDAYTTQAVTGMAAGEGLLLVPATNRLVALGSASYDPAEGDNPPPPAIELPPETAPPVEHPPAQTPPVVAPPTSTLPVVIVPPTLSPPTVPVATAPVPGTAPSSSTQSPIRSTPAPPPVQAQLASGPTSAAAPAQLGHPRRVTLTARHLSVVLRIPSGRIVAIYRESARGSGKARARVHFYVGAVDGRLHRAAVAAFRPDGHGGRVASTGSLRIGTGRTRLVACVPSGPMAQRGCGAVSLAAEPHGV